MGSFNSPELNNTVLCCFTIFIPPSPVVEFEPEKAERISPLLIVIVCILGGCFLLVSYFAIIVKYCANLKKSRRPQVQIEEDLESHGDFFDENHGVVNHPIWYIHTVGLAQSVIESIGVFGYNKEEGLVEGTECLVCLSEFEEDEALRLLPKCSHAFHVSCIDTWLTSHTNCPCCRAPIVAGTVVAVDTGVEPSLGSSAVGEATEGVDLESGNGVDSGQTGDSGTRDLGVRAEDARKEDDRSKDAGIAKNDLELSESLALRNLADSDWVAQNGKQPVKRSASLDFNSHPLKEEENSMVQKHGNLNLGLDKTTCSSSKGVVLSKHSFSLKRSFSSGGKLMPSRLNRTRSAILPL